MEAVVLKNADQMMTSAYLNPDGIQVSFADGCSGTIPFKALKDVEEPTAITGLELPNPFELYLVGKEGRYPEIPWDFARHYCDSTYRERVEAQTVLGRQRLGGRIRQFRKSAGLTQEALARAAGIGRVTLVRLERGEQTAKFKTLSAIAKAIGRPTMDLFFDTALFDATGKIAGRQVAESALNQLASIEIAAWSENHRRHSIELEGLDEASSEAFLGLKRVIEGFDILLGDPDSEPQVDLIEEALNLSARIFKSLRSAKILCEMGYYGQTLVLARSCLEHLLVAYDLPLSATTRQTLRTGGEFRFSEMVERVEENYPEIRFKDRWNRNYPYLSKFVHPSGTRMQQLPFPSGEVGYVVPLTNYYDPNLVSAALEVIWGELRLLIHMVHGMANAVREEWDATDAYEALRRIIPPEK